MNKYVFKPWSPLFPGLFDKERERLAPHLKKALAIEHVGSTAVRDLGGKGIIDIAIAVHKGDMEPTSQQLQALGYEFRPSFSTPERFYLIIYLPDPEEGTRRYHVHLTFPESSEWKGLIGFRDYLRTHPEDAREYAELKKQAALESSQEGALYRKIKEPVIRKIQAMIHAPEDIPTIAQERIDDTLVRRLVAAQFPQWKDLPVRPVALSGWDNRTFHLGEEMLVRMPSAAAYASQVEKEQHWLPKLAPHLPLPIPVPLAIGEPMEDYPWKWSIYRWLDGESAATADIADLADFAEGLAHFLTALERIDATGGPMPGPHSFYRGGSLAHYDAEVRQSLTVLKSRIDVDAAARLWEAALATSWSKAPVWMHGDISVGNLLVQKRRLCAVIDFGQLAVGDPACDLAIAWTLFKGRSREVFQERLPFDPGTWARGRAWCLWKALVVAAGFTNPNNVESAGASRIIEAVLAEDDL